MFTDYEPLRCSICGHAFMGRKPADGGDILCPECLGRMEESVINDHNSIPADVLAEISGGKE